MTLHLLLEKSLPDPILIICSPAIPLTFVVYKRCPVSHEHIRIGAWRETLSVCMSAAVFAL